MIGIENCTKPDPVATRETKRGDERVCDCRSAQLVVEGRAEVISGCIHAFGPGADDPRGAHLAQHRCNATKCVYHFEHRFFNSILEWGHFTLGRKDPKYDIAATKGDLD